MTEPSPWDAMNEIPIAATADPVTSHEAAAAVTKGGERYRQLAAVSVAVLKWPGRTSAELAKLSGLDRHLVARRLPELEKLGTVVRGEPRICTASTKPGLRAMTWSRT